MEVTDYVDFTYYEMPTKERRKLDVGDIFLNQVSCKKCGWVIRSKNRHHMVYCKCKSISIDGGSWYSRATAKDLDDINWHTVYYKHRPRRKKLTQNNQKTDEVEHE